MADVDVDISATQVHLALNAPGGLVFEWMRETLNAIEQLAMANSPVNNPLNAMHRGGVVGTYKRSWSTTPPITSADGVSGSVSNSAAHAYFVEEGRGPALQTEQVFSWTGFKPPGSIHQVMNTKGYPRQRVLYYATQDVLEAQTDHYVPWL